MPKEEAGPSEWMGNALPFVLLLVPLSHHFFLVKKNPGTLCFMKIRALRGKMLHVGRVVLGGNGKNKSVSNPGSFSPFATLFLLVRATNVFWILPKEKRGLRGAEGYIP